MSVRCIDKVLNGSRHAGTELLMLVVLADYSDDDGNSYPAVASLARKCRMSSRNANYILNALQASSELRVLKNQGPRGTNRYRIMLNALGAETLKPTSPLKSSSPLKPTSATPEAGFPKPLKPTSDEPSLNRQEPAQTESDDSPNHAVAPSDKDKVWAIGRELLGEKSASFLGKLAKDYGDAVLAEALVAAQQNMPLHEPRSWVKATCASLARKAPAGARKLDNATPAWATKAGFKNRFEAENDGCFEHNAAAFRGGKRIGGAA